MDESSVLGLRACPKVVGCSNSFVGNPRFREDRSPRTRGQGMRGNLLTLRLLSVFLISVQFWYTSGTLFSLKPLEYWLWKTGIFLCIGSMCLKTYRPDFDIAHSQGNISDRQKRNHECHPRVCGDQSKQRMARIIHGIIKGVLLYLSCWRRKM